MGLNSDIAEVISQIDKIITEKSDTSFSVTVISNSWFIPTLIESKVYSNGESVKNYPFIF